MELTLTSATKNTLTLTYNDNLSAIKTLIMDKSNGKTSLFTKGNAFTDNALAPAHTISAIIIPAHLIHDGRNFFQTTVKKLLT